MAHICPAQRDPSSTGNAPGIHTLGTIASSAGLRIQPTLFVSLGGAGKDVVLRVRHAILAAAWGRCDAPVYIEKLSAFPLAEFMHFDTDAHCCVPVININHGPHDRFSAPMAYSNDEVIAGPPDQQKYLKDQDSMNAFAHIQAWLPLNYRRLKDMNLDPSLGIGPVRSLARLHFYNRYQEVRAMMRAKIERLSNSTANEDILRPLGLEAADSLRVVLVCSFAGSAGSGSFLDMGFLAKILAEATGKRASVELLAVMPTAYASHGPDTIPARGYASLMELETLMMHEVAYVERWDADAPVCQPKRPFDQVYVCDTTNLAGEHARETAILYQMMAESLVGDLRLDDFGMRKRAIARNQTQFKSGVFTAPMSKQYRDLNLSYSNACSAFGQFTIDTQFEPQRDIAVAQRVHTMLESFFGIGLDAHKPTGVERDALMREHMLIAPAIFTLKYRYAGNAAPGFEEQTEMGSSTMVEALLHDQAGRSLVDNIAARIHNDIGQIKAAGERDQWPAHIADLKRRLEHDAFDSAGTQEQIIAQRRRALFAQITAADSPLLKSLWDMLENNERGGIFYTRELIDSIKDCIGSAGAGLLGALQKSRTWFGDLSDKIHTGEIGALEIKLGQTHGANLLSFDNSRQQRAETLLGQLGEALSMWVSAHLHAVACREASTLLSELSMWLGEKTADDNDTGAPQWGGFIGVLVAGHQQVERATGLMRAEIAATRMAMTVEHGSRAVIAAPNSVLDAMAREMVAGEAAIQAQETFAGYGDKRALLARLTTKEGCAALIAALRETALRTMPAEVLHPRIDPLFEALRSCGDMDALFKQCLRRAMPWIDADLSGLFVANRNQYRCLIGVTDAAAFEKQFGAALRQAAPMQAGFGADIIGFAETATPGKLTCYIEFSGLPLTALRALPAWRKSYDSHEKNKAWAPLHTSSRKSAFVHPLHPAPDDIDKMEHDFRDFLLAVGTGVLKRRADDGSYQIVRKGNKLAIGVERLVRLQGISADYRGDVQKQVKLQIDRAKTALQLCALSVLFDAYTEEAYLPRVVTTDEQDRTVSGMGHFVCTRLREHFREEFLARAIDEQIADPAAMAHMLRERIEQWTDLIDHSHDDDYGNEVAVQAREKRVVKPQFFDPGWLAGLRGGAAAPVAVAPPRPADLPDIYYVVLDKVAVGPVGASELLSMTMARSVAPDSLVCLVGARQWSSASSITALMPLFAAQATADSDDNDSL
jgi:hypothetical protein